MQYAIDCRHSIRALYAHTRLLLGTEAPFFCAQRHRLSLSCMHTMIHIWGNTVVRESLVSTLMRHTSPLLRITLPANTACACWQARQQSVEEVNQRWAAKSHTLLSRIANLEQQLQGQGQGQSGTSPTSDFQVRHKPPFISLLFTAPQLALLRS